MRLPDDIVLKDVTLKDQYFDLQSLSAYSSLSVSTLRDYIRLDGLPCFRVRGKILVRQNEFDRWMSNFRIHSVGDVNKIVDDAIGEIRRRS